MRDLNQFLNISKLITIQIMIKPPIKLTSGSNKGPTLDPKITPQKDIKKVVQPIIIAGSRIGVLRNAKLIPTKREYILIETAVQEHRITKGIYFSIPVFIKSFINHFATNKTQNQKSKLSGIS